MTTDFRPIMQALFEHLKAAAIIDFVADAAARRHPDRCRPG
jgi:hypothetical protein